MSELRIDAHIGDDESAVIELIDSRLQTRQESLTPFQPLTFDVPDGEYLLRTNWSNGQQSEQVVKMSGHAVTLDLESPFEFDKSIIELGDPIAVESIGQKTQGHIAPPVLPGAIGNLLSRRILEFDWVDLPETLDSDTLPIQLWRRGSIGWESAALDGPLSQIEGGFQFELEVDEKLHLIEIGFGDIRQYISVPAERSILALRLHQVQSETRIRADVRTADREVEALRGFIQRGQITVAHKAAPEVMAERYLRSKMAAPRIAALGAYFLLRVGDLDRLHNWPDNLANWKQWLPDGPVIAAWQRLRMGNPDYEKVFDLLMESVQRGLPVYTEGVRLLKDGLDLFASDDQKHWEVAEAQQQVERYAKAMVWDKTETTFFGLGPDDPQANASEPGIWM